jgi:hypothetical protein
MIISYRRCGKMLKVYKENLYYTLDEMLKMMSNLNFGEAEDLIEPFVNDLTIDKMADVYGLTNIEDALHYRNYGKAKDMILSLIEELEKEREE